MVSDLFQFYSVTVKTIYMSSASRFIFTQIKLIVSEKFCTLTGTRFEREAQANSKMALCGRKRWRNNGFRVS